MTPVDRQFRPDATTIPPTGAVEVARICDPNPATSDMVRVLAMREGRRIIYRTVTGDGDEVATRSPTALPLTTGQLIHLIDRAGEVGSRSHYLLTTRRRTSRPGVPACRAFSDHYPMLPAIYAARYRPDRPPQRRRESRVQQIDASRMATIRRGLLANLAWEERTAGIRRNDTDREAAVRRFLSLRFTP